MARSRVSGCQSSTPEDSQVFKSTSLKCTFFPVAHHFQLHPAIGVHLTPIVIHGKMESMHTVRNKTALWAALERWLPQLELLANAKGVKEDQVLEDALEAACARGGIDPKVALDQMIDEAEASGTEEIADLNAWAAERENGLSKRLKDAAV
jgi:hypothetical protein